MLRVIFVVLVVFGFVVICGEIIGSSLRGGSDVFGGFFLLRFACGVFYFGRRFFCFGGGWGLCLG